jgi:hypothetical protein
MYSSGGSVPESSARASRSKTSARKRKAIAEAAPTRHMVKDEALMDCMTKMQRQFGDVEWSGKLMNPFVERLVQDHKNTFKCTTVATRWKAFAKNGYVTQARRKCGAKSKLHPVETKRVLGLIEDSTRTDQCKNADQIQQLITTEDGGQ